MTLPSWTKSLPKKVTICGIRYKIRYNMAGGAYFSCSKGGIVVGCRDGKDTAVQALIHEISEIIHILTLTRFNAGCSFENGDMRFFMSHDDFERHNNELYAALKDCKLLRR